MSYDTEDQPLPFDMDPFDRIFIEIIQEPPC